MAKTSKGIYYPSDYNAIADIPEDMKQMAESIDKILEEDESNINTNTARIIQLEQKKDMLSKQMPWNTVQGESIHIQDSAEWDENKLSLSGNLKQETRSGKNKFKLPESATSNGITYTNNGDGTFNLSGTATESAVFKITVEIEKTGISWGNQITLSSNVTTDINKFMALQATNGDTWVSSLCALNTGGKKVTVTLTKPGTTHIRFLIQINKGQTIDWKNAYIQLENNPDATDFETYGAMPSTEFPSMPVVATGVQKIRQFGKNLISGWIENKLVSSTGEIQSNASWNTSELIQVESNNFITFYHKTKTSNQSLIIVEYDKNLNFIQRNIQGATTTYTPYTIQTSDNTRYVRLCYDKTKNNTELMLEYNNAATSYEPYTEEINTLDLGTTELCKITDTNGNVVAQDRPVYRNGKWQWEKGVGKYVFKGTESFELWGNGIDSAYRIIYKGLTSTIKKNGLILSDCYPTKLATQLYDFEVGIATDANGNIIIHDNDFTTTDSYKANLVQKYTNGTPLTVYYPLAIPIYEDCTADQSAILDKLYNNFTLQKGTNNIIVETDNGVGVNMQLDYMQDNVLRHDKDITELKQAIVALGGVI